MGSEGLVIENVAVVGRGLPNVVLYEARRGENAAFCESSTLYRVALVTLDHDTVTDVGLMLLGGNAVGAGGGVVY